MTLQTSGPGKNVPGAADTNDTRVAQEERPRPEGLRECQEIIKKKLSKQEQIDKEGA